MRERHAVELKIDGDDGNSSPIRVIGSIAYACQKPWIFSGSVRENILFGSLMRKRHYNEVLEACALTSDLENLPHGHLTIIGERGVNLSDGQKALKRGYV